MVGASADGTGHALFEFSAQFFDFRDLRERVGAFELQKAFAEGDFLHFHAAMFGFELFEFAGVSLDVGAQVVDLLVALHDVLPTAFGFFERSVFLLGFVERAVEIGGLESADGFAMHEHGGAQGLFAVFECAAFAGGLLKGGLHLRASARVLVVFEMEELVFAHHLGKDLQSLVDHLEALEGAVVVFELLSAESEGFELAFELLLFLVALLELVVAFGHLFHGDFEQGGGMVSGFGEAFDFSLYGVSLGDVGLFVTELFFSAVFAFARRVELLFGAFEELSLLCGAAGEFGFGFFDAVAHLFEGTELFESGAEGLYRVIALEFQFVAAQHEELSVGFVESL